MNAPLFAAVLVNYNAGVELRHALQSIADDAGDAPWEAVVVDNASVDDSAEIVREFAAHARLIRNRENVGFGRGVNQGVAATTAPLVMIMNPDCRLEAGALARLRAALAGHDQCAIVGPKILDPDGSVQGSGRGDPDMFTGLFGRTSWLRRRFPRLAVSTRNVVTSAGPITERASTVVDWLSGACLLARRDAFDAVGGFDERYFLYWEDADLCRRLRAHGWQIRYVPGATAVHRVGHSSKTARAASIRAFHQSAYRYYATHVAPSPFNPKRHLAGLLLRMRCWITLRNRA